MRFQVPQFTDVEDKIVGPFTLKQFIYLAGGIGICIILYSFLPLFLAIILMVPIVILSGALAFYKINSKPFVEIMEAFFKYTINGRLYIWKHQPKQFDKVSEKKESAQQNPIPRINNSKLKEINWNLDVKENLNEDKN